MVSLKSFIFELEFKVMKRYLLLLVTTLFFLSCDDGDIIVSDFNFDSDSPLNICELELARGNQKVLYIITETNEAISFKFNQNILENIENIIIPEEFSIPINNSNRVNYRRLSADVNGSDYFCQAIPPSQPNVIEEFVSTTGGSVRFTVTPVSDPNVDTDGDGIPDIEEREVGENGLFTGSIYDFDTDGDGIPNFLDIDDDNDNIPTLTEIGGLSAPDKNLDTDEDGIPNYLDPDDDGDGIITRYEDLNALDNGTPPIQTDLNPRDDDSNQDGIPNYLDANETESLVVDFFRTNTVSRRFNITVVFKNVTLKNPDTERNIRLNSQGFGVFTFATENEELSFR